MTTPVGHSLFALILFLATRPGGRAIVLLVLLAVAALLPDMDFYPLLWGDFQGAARNHQELTHSIVFVLISAAVLTWLGKRLQCGRAVVLFPLLLAAAGSHLLLDFLTEDSRNPIGIPLLWPFSEERFHSQVVIFGGVIKSSLSDLVSWHNAGVVLWEIIILGSIAAALWFFRYRGQKDRTD